MASMTVLLSILLAAFLGSWHCAIMCGPLCISLSSKGSLWPYQLGRMLSYTLAGALAGAFAQKLLWNQSFIIKIASLFFLSFAFLWLAIDLYRQKQPQFTKQIWQRVLKVKTHSRFFLGILSVFLPCGWLFYFLLAAATTQSALSGALVLFLLYLSSLPALAGSSWLMRERLRKSQPQQHKWATVVITLAGLYALFAHYIFN